jgi:hypothetical protein
VDVKRIGFGKDTARLHLLLAPRALVRYSGWGALTVVDPTPLHIFAGQYPVVPAYEVVVFMSSFFFHFKLYLGPLVIYYIRDFLEAEFSPQ